MSNGTMTDRQWAVLQTVAVVSQEARVWLSGGWALDFHCERVTRRHSDIDLIVHNDDRARFWDAMRATGLRDSRVESSAVVDTVDFAGVRVEVTYICAVGDTMVTPGMEDWPWPDRSFAGPPKRFHDVDFLVVSVEGLLDMKMRYEEFLGQPMREHDKVDVLLLRELINEEPRPSEPPGSR